MDNCLKTYIVIGAFDRERHQFIQHILDYLELDPLIFCLEENPPQDLDVIYRYPVKFLTFFSLAESLVPEQTNVILLPQDRNLADSIQAIYEITQQNKKIRIEKIISIIDAVSFENNSKILLDAMAYFSDILYIFDPQQSLKKTQVNEFTSWCKKKECYPLPIVHITKNWDCLNELLLDDTRRMTLIFDDIDPIDLLEFDENNLPTKVFSIPNLAQMDKYLQTDDSGKRVNPIPNF